MARVSDARKGGRPASARAGATLLRPAAALFGAAWEARRMAYALGLARPRRVAARVVSVGNLSVGGTGKTTLTLHLARRALERGVRAAVVCRRYRPMPDGRGDEEALYQEALGPGRVFAGGRKVDLAGRAAAAGHELVLVDDGFSHWALGRDADLVLLDARDPWGGGLLPAGRMREPRRALQRAAAVVVSGLARAHDPAPWLEQARAYAPGARLAAGRHRVTGVRAWAGGSVPAGGRAWLVSGTGNPAAVEESAREAGFEIAGRSLYRDHHAFRDSEARAERERAARAGACVLLSPKDAVRWPAGPAGADERVLEVEWEWRVGGAEVEALVFGDGDEA